MKKLFKMVMMVTCAALLVASCSQQSDIDGFKKTKSGLHYKFITNNKDGNTLAVGDVIVGELKMFFKNDTVFNNFGNPQRIIRVQESAFPGDINEGLRMLHVGDYAIFAVDCDSMAKMFTGQMPPNYTPGNGDKMYYEIKVADVITANEMAQEEANYRANMEERRLQEPKTIADYISAHNITATPNADGLYIIVRKKGNGPKVEMGKQVQMDYAGYLLDSIGTLFDTSKEKLAKEGGLYNPNREYTPLSYVVGKMGLIKGWENGVMGQPAGTQLTLIIPSELGYGSNGAGNLIEPYTPLRFEIEILSVK